MTERRRGYVTTYSWVERTPMKLSDLPLGMNKVMAEAYDRDLEAVQRRGERCLPIANRLAELRKAEALLVKAGYFRYSPKAYIHKQGISGFTECGVERGPGKGVLTTSYETQVSCPYCLSDIAFGCTIPASTERGSDSAERTGR